MKNYKIIINRFFFILDEKGSKDWLSVFAVAPRHTGVLDARKYKNVKISESEGQLIVAWFNVATHVEPFQEFQKTKELWHSLYTTISERSCSLIHSQVNHFYWQTVRSQSYIFGYTLYNVFFDTSFKSNFRLLTFSSPSVVRSQFISCWLWNHSS